MFRYILLILSFAFHSHSAQADEYIEYNKWYSKDGVLYDITQTQSGDPVMLSIFAAGKNNANLVVSYFSQGACEKDINQIRMDGTDFPAKYVCIPEKNGKINHYTVTDAGSVNYLVERLKSGFTVLLQDNIKVWVENFNNPKYGSAPNFW